MGRSLRRRLFLCLLALSHVHALSTPAFGVPDKVDLSHLDILPAPKPKELKPAASPAVVAKIALERLATEIKDDPSQLWIPANAEARKFAFQAIPHLLTLNDTDRAAFLAPLLGEKTRGAVEAMTAAWREADVQRLIDQADFRNRGTFKPGQQFAAQFEIERRIEKNKEIVAFLANHLKLSDANALNVLTQMKAATGAKPDPEAAAKLATLHVGSLIQKERVAFDAALAGQISKATEQTPDNAKVLEAFALGSWSWLKAESKNKDVAKYADLGDSFVKTFRTSAKEHETAWQGSQAQFWNRIDELVELEESTQATPTYRVKFRGDVAEAKRNETLGSLRSDYDERELTRFAKSLRDSGDARYRALGAKLDFALFRKEGENLYLPLEKTTLGGGATHQAVALPAAESVDTEAVASLIESYDSRSGKAGDLHAVSYDLDTSHGVQLESEDRSVWTLNAEKKLEASPLKAKAQAENPEPLPEPEIMPMAEPKPEPVKPALNHAAVSANLQKCASCHGDGGQKPFIDPKDLGRTKGRLLRFLVADTVPASERSKNARLAAVVNPDGAMMQDAGLDAEQAKAIREYLEGESVEPIHDAEPAPKPELPEPAPREEKPVANVALHSVLARCAKCHSVDAGTPPLISEDDPAGAKASIFARLGLVNPSESDLLASPRLMSKVLGHGTPADGKPPMVKRAKGITAEEEAALNAWFFPKGIPKVKAEEKGPFTPPTKGSLGEAFESALAHVERQIPVAADATALKTQRANLIQLIEALKAIQTKLPDPKQTLAALFGSLEGTSPIKGSDLIRHLLNARGELEARLAAAPANKEDLTRRLEVVKGLLAADVVRGYLKEEGRAAVQDKRTPEQATHFINLEPTNRDYVSKPRTRVPLDEQGREIVPAHSIVVKYGTPAKFPPGFYYFATDAQGRVGNEPVLFNEVFRGDMVGLSPDHFLRIRDVNGSPSIESAFQSEMKPKDRFFGAVVARAAAPVDLTRPVAKEEGKEIAVLARTALRLKSGGSNDTHYTRANQVDSTFDIVDEDEGLGYFQTKGPKDTLILKRYRLLDPKPFAGGKTVEGKHVVVGSKEIVSGISLFDTDSTAKETIKARAWYFQDEEGRLFRFAEPVPGPDSTLIGPAAFTALVPVQSVSDAVPETLVASYVAHTTNALGAPVATSVAAGSVDGSPLRAEELALLGKQAAPAPRKGPEPVVVVKAAPQPAVNVPVVVASATVVRRFTLDIVNNRALAVADAPAPVVGGKEQLPPGRVVLKPNAQGTLFFYWTDNNGVAQGPLLAGQRVDGSFLGLPGQQFVMQGNGTFSVANFVTSRRPSRCFGRRNCR